MTKTERAQPAVPQPQPPSFGKCFVCTKQFGPRSLAPHEQSCLARWRAANAALPPEQRAPTPCPPKAEDDRTPSPPPAPMTPPLNSSWPRSNGTIRCSVDAQSSPRVTRPKTATLKQPRVLDTEKKDELDMSTTRCSELLEIVSLNKAKMMEEGGLDEKSETVERPKTIRLTQASKDLNVPNIDYHVNSAVISPDRVRTKQTRLGRRLPNFTLALEQLFNVPKKKASVPHPCVSCGKQDNPERFHSHPVEPPPGTSPKKRAKRSSQGKKRLSTQKPVAIKYRPPPVVAPPPDMDPVTQRKRELEEEQRLKQERLKEEYLRKEEKSRKAREEAMRKKLAFANKQKPAAARDQLKLVVCYVCGRQFATNSLPIHQPQCLEKWRRDNEALPKEEQKPEPKPPSEAPQENGAVTPDYGDGAFVETQTSLVPCSLCGRTFFPDRVALHEKNCRSKDGGNPAKAAAAQSEVPAVCYICKARFPPEQIGAHEKECVARWRAQNAVIAKQIVLPEVAPAVPVAQTVVVPQPPADTGEKLLPINTEKLQVVSAEKPEPENGEKLQSESFDKLQPINVKASQGPVERLEGQLDELIGAAWQSHLSELVPCPACSRTFFPDRLEKHQRNCTGAGVRGRLK